MEIVLSSKTRALLTYAVVFLLVLHISTFGICVQKTHAESIGGFRSKEIVCREAAGSAWNADEVSVWQQICLNSDSLRVGNDDAQHYEIGNRFLKDIFTGAAFSELIPKDKILLRNIIFRNGVDLSAIELKPSLVLVDCLSLKNFDISYSSFNKNLEILNSFVFGKLDARSVKVDLLFLIRNIGGETANLPIDPLQKVSFGALDISDMRVADSFLLGNVVVLTDVTANNVHVSGSLEIAQCDLTRLKATDSIVGQQFDSINSFIVPNKEYKLRAPSINLFGSSINSMIIVGTKIDSTPGNVDVDLESSAVSGSLSVSSSDFCTVNFAGAKFFEAIDFEDMNKRCFLTANLRDVSVSILSIPLDSWARNSNDLRGLVVRRLGDGFFSKSGTRMDDNEIKSKISLWLNSSSPYSPEPFEETAKALEGMGRHEFAEQALYENRERQLSEAFEKQQYTRFVFLYGYKIFVGYGLEPQYSLIWASFFIVAGFFVKKANVESKRVRMGTRWVCVDERVSPLLYSIDMFLPVISLGDGKGELPTTKKAKAYFILHKAAGFVLGTYVLAALGLGK